MSNLVVKYNNKMNLLAFKDIDKIEANLFFNIIARLKEKGTESVIFNFSELTEFLDKNLTTKETIDLLKKGVGKIVRTAIEWEVVDDEGHQILFFTLFNEFKINTTNNTLKASINPKFLYILNNFKEGNFTMFELAEFSSLSSKYSQTLYRLLKQFRSTGYLTMPWGDFLEIMDIPKSYRMFDIERQILKPSILELTKEADILNQKNIIFKTLHYKKIRGKGKGRPVERIEFYFTAQKNTKQEQEKSDKALEIIAQEIKQEQRLKQIKKDEAKKQRLRVKEISQEEFEKQTCDLETYINRHFRVKNKFDGGYDTCKIKDIYQTKDGKVKGKAINQENDKIFDLEFESLQHLKNALKLL